MILKRTLNRKSTLGFGYYDTRDLPIQMLLDLKKDYLLIAAYYNLEKIDFVDDILNELGITKEFRIEKPGKNKELGEKFKEYKFNLMTDIERLKYMSFSKKEIKKRTSRSNAQKTFFRADNMRARNHNNK